MGEGIERREIEGGLDEVKIKLGGGRVDDGSGIRNVDSSDNGG